MIVYGERLLAPRGPARRCSTSPRGWTSRGRPGAGLLEIPATRTAAACARRASPRHTGPATRRAPSPGSTRRASPTALGDRRAARAVAAPRRPAAHVPTARVGGRARRRADGDRARVLADGPIREHADVVFPAEAYPEKEGTLTHPDGRVQRLRPAIGRPGRGLGAGVRASGRCSPTSRARRPRPGVFPGRWLAQLFAAVPFYAGLTLDEIGGRGMRWPEREGARAAPGAWEPAELDCRRRRRAAPAARCARHLAAAVGRQGGRRSRRCCSSCARASTSSSRPPTPTRSAYARAISVEVGANGTRVRGTVHLRARCRAAPSSSPRARRRTRRTADRGGRRRGEGRGRRRRAPRSARRRPWSAAPAMTVRRGRLLRALVDPAPQGGDHLRGRLPARADRAARRPQGARPLPDRYGPNRVGPFGLLSRWPTSASCCSRSSSARAPRSGGCSRSRR